MTVSTPSLPPAASATTMPPSAPYTVIETEKGKRTRLHPLPEYVSDEAINLTPNSIKVLEKRYLRRDLDGALLETPAGMFYRIAYHLAQVEKEHGGDVEAVTRTFYDLMTERRFYPNSPTFTGAGTPLGQLAACFVLPIEDDMGKSSDGIFSTLRVAALIQQTGGGNGFSFSRLRPKNDIVHTSSGRATGPVGFLRVYDQAFGEIAQGGSRRGANMAVLRVDHPDIEDFIACKAEEGAITNFNISVAITDEFMQAVKDDADFNLRNPRDGSVWKKVRARELFDKIVKYAHHNGEPGALFIDAANRSNPVPHLYDLEATNPCVTGDTLIYTAKGMRRAKDLVETQDRSLVVLDGRFGESATFSPNSSPVFYSGDKPVFRVKTKEGYSLKATADHKVMTTAGWMTVDRLSIGTKLHILNRKGGFGDQGSLELGRVLGWLFGDGTFNISNAAGLMFFGEEQEVAPMFAGYVNDLTDEYGHKNVYSPTRKYAVGVQEVTRRAESRVISTRLKEMLAKLGVVDKETMPEILYSGTEDMQRGFLQGIFSADGTVVGNAEKSVSVRLWSNNEEVLFGVQGLLLNFGIASRVYLNRKPAHAKAMPGGTYQTKAGHELVVSKTNLLRFQEEIGFLVEAKSQKLYNLLESYGRRGPYAETYTATVSEIEPFGVEPVYDLSEPLTRSFVANGIVVHNCGEQWLGPYENCCLGSINLAVHVTADDDGQAQVDWELLRRSVEESTHFLDNVVSANAYVPVVSEVAQAAYRARRIGLGIMGLGDLMYHLGIRYGSEEGQEFAAQVMEFIRLHCMAKSIELARKRGSFLAFEGSIYDANQHGGMKWQAPQPLFPYSRDWHRPALDWSQIIEGIQQHGLRNAAQTTVAPTGCLVPGTLVVTDQGVLPIEELGDVKGKQWQDIQYTVASEGGNLPTTQFYINGRAHTMRVVTKRGYQLQGTDQHRIRVWQDGVCVWRRMDELAPGMLVPLKAAGLVGEPRRVPLVAMYVTDLHPTPIRLPTELTPELAYLVGFFMGDGSLKERSLRFAVSDAATQQRLLQYAQIVFGISGKVVTDQRSQPLKSVEFHSRNLVAFWRNNGFAKFLPDAAHQGKGYKPHIPLAILRSNDIMIYSTFLAGLFDADGSLHQDRLLTWTTTTQVLHDQVKALLLVMGVLTTSDLQTTGLGGSASYRLRTAHTQATERLARLLTHLCRLTPGENTVRRKTLGDTIPLSLRQYEAALAMTTNTTEERRLWGWRQREWQASRSSLAAFVTNHRSEMLASGLDDLVATIDNDIFFDEIEAVEDGGWQETYDISVPQSHAYIANGFVSHNTIATVCGCEGYGCEPVFALGYVRHFKDGDKDVELLYTSPLFEAALNRTDLSEARKQAIKEHVATYGACQEIPDLPEWMRHTFVVSSDITAEEHVRMQAAIQAFVDNSISKCITGDSLVLTTQGLVALRELSEMRNPDQFEDLELEVLSPAGREMTDAFYYGGYRETRLVSLEYGFEIEGTPNHRIHVLANDGTVQFRQIDEIKPGDTVVLYSGQQQFGQGSQPLPSYTGVFRSNSNRILIPQQMSEEFAFFLGCITSEGAITRNGVSITNTDTSLLATLQSTAQALFGLAGTIVKDARNDVHALVLNSRALRNWLLVDLRLEAGAENKIIPACILSASREEVAAFLRGLFLDGFMTQNGKLFGITLASQQLIGQLQTLLLNMGVLATARQTAERAWNLTVQGGELEALADEISFVEVWKNERIAQRNLGRLQRFRNYSRLLPRRVTQALQTMQQETAHSLRSLYTFEQEGQPAAYQRARVNLLQGHRLERSDARQIYEHLRQDSANDFADQFFAQDNGQKVYVEVQNVGVGFAEVFDLSVPGSHSFIANGLGNHNTCNFPEGATVEDVAQAYLLAWELGAKGLTVYVTGSRQEVVLETKATKQKKGETAPEVAGATETIALNGHAPSNGYADGFKAGAEATQPETRPLVKKRPRPNKLSGSTYRKETPLGRAYITVNSDERGEPLEVFLNVGKAGSEVSAVSEAIGRLVSLVLRMPGTLPANERLRWMIDELADIGGGRPLGFGAKRVRSLPDGIAQVLAEHLSELPPGREQPQAEQLALPIHAQPLGDICPDCGEATLLNVEGCRKCQSCGYSEC